jgi:hypothetical protein
LYLLLPRAGDSETVLVRLALAVQTGAYGLC